MNCVSSKIRQIVCLNVVHLQNKYVVCLQNHKIGCADMTCFTDLVTYIALTDIVTTPYSYWAM